MHIYAITDFDQLPISIRPTLGGAHEVAKAMSSRADLQIELHDLPTDKDSIVALARAAYLDEGPDPLRNPLRTWVITNRGGLKETTEE